MDRPTRPEGAVAVLLSSAVAFGIALATGCGESDEGSQPAPDVSSFEQGDFENIPLHPTSTPLGPRSEDDGTVSRSYSVRDTTPRMVLEFYRSELREHDVVRAPRDIGQQSWRGRWLVDGRELTVSATEIDQPGDVAEETPADRAAFNTQYSLVLGPE